MHPSTKQVIELAKSGMPPREIGPLVGRSRAAVSAVLKEARKRGEAIPRFASCGRPPVMTHVAESTEEMLSPHADARGITVKKLAELLIRSAAEANLIDAILDDRENGHD